MRKIIAFAVLTVLAGCAGAPKVVPRAAPRPVPVYVPPPPPPAPLPSDWRDWPYTPGDWRYARDARGSVATFGAGAFVIRCDPAANVVVLSRSAAAAAPLPMTVRTSSTLRTLTTQPTGAGLVVSLTPRDGLLEAMAFSRGRFVVEQPGLPALVLPSWAEIGRVTEDCRR